MITLDQLAHQIDAYCQGRTNLEQFQNWFESNLTRGIYETQGKLLDACLEVDAAFSSLSLDGIEEAELKLQLAKAIRSSVPVLRIVSPQAFGVPSRATNGERTLSAPLPPGFRQPRPASNAFLAAAHLGVFQSARYMKQAS